jgi:hypothetical protein
MEEITAAEEVIVTRPRGLGPSGGFRRLPSARPPPSPHLLPSPHDVDGDDNIDEAKQLFLKSLRFLSKVRLTIVVSAIVDEALPAALSGNLLGRGVRWCSVALTSWLVRERGGGGGGERDKEEVDEQHSDAVIGLHRVEILLE